MELTRIRDKIINRITVLTAVLLSVSYAFSILRALETGWKNLYLLHTILYFAIVAMAIFRPKLRPNFKIAIISGAYLIISIAGLYTFSIAGGYYYAVMAVAILTLLTERKVSITILATTALIFIAIGFLHINKIISPIHDLNAIAANPFHWISTTNGVIMLILIFIYGFGDIYKELLNSREEKYSSERKFRLLFEKANDAVILFENKIILDCNEMACEYFQLPKDQLLGKSIIELSPPKQYDGEDSTTKANNLISLTLAGNPQRFEWQHLKSDGSLFDLSISLNMIKLPDSTPYLQAVLRDITEKKKQDAQLKEYQLHLTKLVEEKTSALELALEELQTTNEELEATNEELHAKHEIINVQNTELKNTISKLKETQSQLVQSEKMASLGILTAGVAHEINNPLNYIMGGSVALENYFNEYGSNNPDKTDFILKSIQTGLDRATNIVSSLSQFSRGNSGRDEDCDIHKIIDNCIVMLNNKIKNRIRIEKKYCGKKLMLKGNVGQLHQAFVNILSNASDAIMGNGTISIETDKAEDNTISVKISDTGCGISQEHLHQVTDPFFTTKPPGKGTGLGLSITYSILQDHNAQMSIESIQDQGTSISLTFSATNSHS